MLVTKQLTVAIDFHSIFFYTIEVNGFCQLFGDQYYSKKIKKIKKIIKKQIILNKLADIRTPLTILTDVALHSLCE